MNPARRHRKAETTVGTTLPQGPMVTDPEPARARDHGLQTQKDRGPPWTMILRQQSRYNETTSNHPQAKPLNQETRATEDQGNM
ncbi:hypothetical protein BJY01DRAFT_222019 [Aspergillus pseudoustus]|uniref:Uncharacterized protein n=1 Tax=Aspergillus pseudoustus TaxID=1810923 RepID=A0ABR4J8N0_9EURO